MELLNLLGYFLFVAAVGYYTITNLQWYAYRLERVIFHHTKPMWHVWYFLLPYGAYMLANAAGGYGFVVAFVYIAALWMWHKRLDKPLVFTGRVKRYFAVLALIALLSALAWHKLSVLLPVLGAVFVSMAIEKILFAGFKRRAKEKLAAYEGLKVVGVTASYGKTSMKNFIAHLLSGKYRTYATPRSVNTLGGVMKDINDDLPADTEVYVVEMGARNAGDIAEIATFVEPHIAVVGRIGPAHIEYFKTLENIRDTKMEIMRSARLQKGFVHESAHVKPDDSGRIETFGEGNGETMPMHRIEHIEATLEGTSFTLDAERYHAAILGAFNAQNLAAAVLVAKALGVDDATIRERLASLRPVPHRLQRIDAGGKLILDDSFNGNIDGMLTAFELASQHQGRKVLITPGLVEADAVLNEKVAKKANEVFDLVIVTGELNKAIFKRFVDEGKLLFLDNKAEMEAMLAKETKPGDLILFANDAPSFV
jgi:UDP-N-acetylmuramoyl-tripeptide--D-alanyl-D-alanine ligase